MIAQTQLPFETERQLNAELDSGETVLWSGQPRPRLFTIQSIALFLFGLPWMAFSVFWVVMASGIVSGFGGHTSGYHGSPAPFGFFPLIFPLFGLPFVLVGVWMLSSPYWIWRKALKTVYAVTGKRALILEPNWHGSITVRSIPPAHLADRTRTQNRDGSGDLIFTHLTTVSSSGEEGTTTQTVGFAGIPDVKAVDDLLGKTFG